MGRKHNTKHPERGLSNYKGRLHIRGYSKSPTMESLETLRKRQAARSEAHEHSPDEYAGWNVNQAEEQMPERRKPRP